MPNSQGLDASLLDEDEQDQVVRALEREARQSAARCKLMIGIMGAGLVGMYCYFAAWAIRDFGSIRHHAELQDVLRPAAVSVGELGGAVAVASGALAVVMHDTGRERHVRTCLRLAFTFTLLEALLWTATILKLLRMRDYKLVRRRQ